MLTPGYAPLEQYSRDGHQGPWSDIYAMAGVLYRALVNENPPDAVSRTSRLQLAKAFQERDPARASAAAAVVYGIDA